MKKIMVSGWVSVGERLPRRQKNSKRSRDVLLLIPKRDGCHQHGVYIGHIEPKAPDDGSGNIFGLKLPGSEWTIAGWSYYEHPVPSHWMEIPKVPKVGGLA